MDPIVTGLVNLGGLGMAVAILYRLHIDALKAFREEMREERMRSDRNLAVLFEKMDGISDGLALARCRHP